MTIRSRVEELEAWVEHLQDRVDGLRDMVQENAPSSLTEYYWNKFEDLLAWSMKVDKNSEEYSRLNEGAWFMFDKYMDVLLTHPFGEARIIHGTRKAHQIITSRQPKPQNNSDTVAKRKRKAQTQHANG